MATFVHLAAEKDARSIKRSGIARLRRWSGRPHGLFATPVTPDLFATHQWLRELKRRGRGPIAGIYFRIPDSQAVWVGHYGGPHEQMTAAQASAFVLRATDRRGLEVIVPRPVTSREVCRVRHLTQVVGWRYFPGAHGRRPCGCSFCQRGEYGAQRLREKYEAQYRKGRNP